VGVQKPRAEGESGRVGGASAAAWKSDDLHSEISEISSSEDEILTGGAPLFDEESRMSAGRLSPRKPSLPWSRNRERKLGLRLRHSRSNSSDSRSNHGSGLFNNVLSGSRKSTPLQVSHGTSNRLLKAG